MKRKTIHEPKATLMSADDAIADADRLKQLRQPRNQTSPSSVELHIPFDTFLAALDRFQRKELLAVKQRLEKRLVSK